MRNRIEVPAILHAQVAHAARFGRALDALLDSIDESDSGAVWLLGRSSEVSAFVRDVVREWCAGRVDPARAAHEIESYVMSLHRAVKRLFGDAFAAPCCRKKSGARAIHGAQLSAARRRLDSVSPTLTQPGGRYALS